MKTVYGFLSLLTLVALLFQNCSRNFRSSSLELGSSAVRFNSLIAGADISWSVEQDASLMKLNKYSRVERWYDHTAKMVPLYPPLITGSQTLDLDHSAQLIETEGGKRLSFGQAASLAPVVQDSSVFLGSDYTVLLAVGNIELPTTDPKVVRVFGLYPINAEEAGVLVLDIADAGEKANFTVFQWFNGTTYSYNQISLPKAELQKGFGIAIRFGKAADQLMFAINGELSAAKATTVGTIPNLGFVNRNLEIHSTGYGKDGSFEFAEIGIFKKALEDNQLEEYSLGLYRTHELQTTTTISGGGSGDETGLTFNAIKPIFQKAIGSGTCLGCHSELNSHSALMGASGSKGKWVVAGSSSSSVLIKAVRQQSDVMAMPKGGGRMEEADIVKLENWINQGAK